MTEVNPLRMCGTRYPTMGFAKVGNDWRFFDLTGHKPQAVGPYYHSKAELLADLYRYAKEYGWES